MRKSIAAFGDFSFWFGLLLLAASLPLSKFGMSLAQFILLGGLLLGSNVSGKLSSAIKKPALWIFWGLYLWHVLGLWNTDDFSFAADDLRIKAPLFLLPLFLASADLTLKKYRIVLMVFVMAVFAATAIAMANYCGLTGRKISDFRDIVQFVSHVRLSLMVCVAVIILAYGYSGHTAVKKALILVLICWFVGFLMILQSITGLIILLLLAFISFMWQVFSSSSPASLRVISLLGAVLLIYFGYRLSNIVFVESIAQIKVDVDTLPAKTPLGNPYFHDLKIIDVENGYALGLYQCHSEMDSVWKLRTGLDPEGKASNGEPYHYILQRFLNSKGLRKDAGGVNALSEAEISAIKNGVGSINNLEGGVMSRVRLLAWEYRQYYYYNNPSAHSMTMRFEFWRVGYYIFQNNRWCGVGTGDIRDEYDAAYLSNLSKLEKEYQYACHNQYLRMAILFGIPGLLYFLFTLIYPGWLAYQRGNKLYLMFLFVLCCSMVSEDTLETQVGATFYAFFNALFFFGFSGAQRVPEKASEGSRESHG